MKRTTVAMRMKKVQVLKNPPTWIEIPETIPDDVAKCKWLQKYLHKDDVK